MRYVVLIYEDEALWRAADDAERARYEAAHRAFTDAARDAGVTVVAGEALAGVAAARTVRHVEDTTVTDGPFAETTEQLTGLYLVDAPDEATLLDLVRLLPETTLEVRECVQP